MAKPSVLVLRTSLVKPMKPTLRHSLYLGDVDVIFGNLPYNRDLLFYKTDTEYASIVDSLKRSLSAVLVQFYPFAGRIAKGDDGKVRGLDCNDAGAEFVEASLDFPFSLLEEGNFPIKDFFGALTRFGDQPRCDNPVNPLLSIQVTKLLGGGIAVGCTASHVVSDGHSFWHFISSWAECSRGLPISVQPLHMRTVLRPENFSLNPVAALEPKKKRHDVESTVAIPEQSEVAIPFDFECPLEELNQTILHLPGDMIKKLKRLSAEDGKPPFSSFIALTAYLWRRLTVAQRLRESQKVGMFVPVNIRGKLIPPLTPAYFGNGVIGATALTTAGQLRRESLGATAARILEAVGTVDDEFVKDVLRRGELWNPYPGVVMTSVANSPRFPCYSADFGWGKPAMARPVEANREGLLVMYPGCPSSSEGSVDVCLALCNQTLKAFFSRQEDDELKHCFIQQAPSQQPSNGLHS